MERRAKTKRTIWVALTLIVIVLTSGMPFLMIPVNAAVSTYYTFSVDPAIHNAYGLTYPVTYEFSLPSGVSSVNVYRRFTLDESWVRIVEKTNGDFFNGIEAVRFDYVNKMAYVSIAFALYSDYFSVYFTDSAGNEISTQYMGTAAYYDNRRVTVTVTIDDLGADPPWGVNEDFAPVSQMFANAKVWWTGGVVTTWISNWQSLQDCVNRGYFEVASHSRNHPDTTPYEDYDSETGGSRDDILSHLTLAYSKGSQGYVWCWIEPSGASDNTVQQKLAQYKYLISRNDAEIFDATDYPNWNPTLGLYDRAYTTVCMDFHSLDELNSYFDSVYATGGIYHVWGHVGQDGWTPGDLGYEHIHHIAGKMDVWYVGFGALYVYAYTRDHVQTMSVAISPTKVRMYVGQSQTFSSTVSGGNSPYSYQWFLNGSKVSGASSSAWTFTPTLAGSYRVYLLVTDSLNVNAQSNTVSDVIVYSQLSVSISPTSVNMTVGQFQTFSSTISGGVSPYAYQWYQNSTAVSGATGSSWTFTAISTGTYNVYLNVTDSQNNRTQSNTAKILVSSQLSTTISPTHVRLYYGQSQTFSSSVSGGTGPYTYQWYLNGTAFSGATSSTWVFTPRANGNYVVYLYVTDSQNVKAQSNIVNDVNVYSPNLVLTSETNKATYVKGKPSTFTVGVFNQLNPSLQSTLTLTITGPNSYYFYDFQPISVAAGAVGEYSFGWVVPNEAGTYTVETSLTPILLTAYDTVWLKVA